MLFLGDSFTWATRSGWRRGSPLSWKRPADYSAIVFLLIQAINKGIIGYGTAQSFLQYVLTREEHRFEVVILGLFTGNDLTDNAAVDSPSGPRPRLILCDPKSAGQELCWMVCQSPRL